MSAALHRLSNGLAVAVDPIFGAESVALGLYAMVGSRSEPEHLSGLAHLVEHMVFKGAGSRGTRELAEAIEDVGGAMNAWTARDQTTFYGRVLARDTALLAELIADLVRAPHLDDAHLEREKAVILSEIGEALDSPDDLVHDHLFEAAFPDQPIGRSILGREESLKRIARRLPGVDERRTGPVAPDSRGKRKGRCGGDPRACRETVRRHEGPRRRADREGGFRWRHRQRPAAV